MEKPPKHLINFLRGWPEPSLLPVEVMKEASSAALSDPQVSVDGLLYAPDAGYAGLRNELATWLSSFYAPCFAVQPAPSITPDRLCVSGGASQNLACVLQAFTDPVYTRYIWMIVPTYFLACRIFEDSGFHGRLRGVPEDEEGVDIDFLRAGLERAEKEANDKHNDQPEIKPPHAWNKRYKHLIYCVPTFSNPSGRTMSVRRRTALVHLAREFDCLIVTDDVYDHLSWPHTARHDRKSLQNPIHAVAPRVVDVDRFLDGGPERSGADGFGNVLSQGTFSKLTGPGCRTGWAEAAPKAAYALSQVGSSRSGGAPSGVVSTFMAELLRRGALQEWIHEKLQPTLAARCLALRAAIQELLVPLGVQFWDEALGARQQEFEGGYFISIQLPEGILAQELADKCQREANCIIAPGPLFVAWGDEQVEGIDLSRMVRLCFSWEQESAGPERHQVLHEGIQRVAHVLTVMQGETTSRRVTAATSWNGISDELR